MVRESAETWFRSYLSMLETYAATQRPRLDSLHPWLGRRYAAWHRLITLNMIRSAATDSMLRTVSPAVWMDQYVRHNAAVCQLVPPDQLLVFHVGEGWDKLCAFLGVVAADTFKIGPYLRNNSKKCVSHILNPPLQYSTFAFREHLSGNELL